MANSVDMPIPYAVGTVLAGYLLVLPSWGVGALWNRLLPTRRFNPWILPCILWVLAYIGWYTNRAHPEPDDMLVALGVLPAALGCLRSAILWRRRPPEEEKFGVRHAPD